MNLCRLVGWMAVAGALAAAGVELARSVVVRAWQPYTFGEAWASVSANSLVGFGSLIENRVSPDLWLNVGLPLLNASLWMVLGGLAVILLALCRRRRRGFSARR